MRKKQKWRKENKILVQNVFTKVFRINRIPRLKLMKVIKDKLVRQKKNKSKYPKLNLFKFQTKRNKSTPPNCKQKNSSRTNSCLNKKSTQLNNSY